MTEPGFNLADGVAVLERTPALLDAWLRGLDDAWLDLRTEGPESFSPRDVLGHLIGGERTDWLSRARIILEHGESRTFDPFDRFAFTRELAGKSAADLLDEFAHLRAANLAALRRLNLSATDMARQGRHPDASFGPVTLGQLLATWVVHDLSHVAQVARVMGKRYAGDVGPWQAYLPMLTR
jgi:DinB superfamily